MSKAKPKRYYKGWIIKRGTVSQPKQSQKTKFYMREAEREFYENYDYNKRLLTEFDSPHCFNDGHNNYEIIWNKPFQDTLIFEEIRPTSTYSCSVCYKSTKFNAWVFMTHGAFNDEFAAGNLNAGLDLTGTFVFESKSGEAKIIRY